MKSRVQPADSSGWKISAKNAKRSFSVPQYSLDKLETATPERHRSKQSITRLSLAEIGQYAELLRANPAFQPSFAEIADLTEVEEFELDADDFLKLADEVDPFSIDAKRAFVARNTTQNHAARMHKILRSQRKFEIFRTVQEAEQWIAD